MLFSRWRNSAALQVWSFKGSGGIIQEVQVDEVAQGAADKMADAADDGPKEPTSQKQPFGNTPHSVPTKRAGSVVLEDLPSGYVPFTPSAAKTTPMVLEDFISKDNFSDDSQARELRLSQLVNLRSSHMEAVYASHLDIVREREAGHELVEHPKTTEEIEEKEGEEKEGAEKEGEDNKTSKGSKSDSSESTHISCPSDYIPEMQESDMLEAPGSPIINVSKLCVALQDFFHSLICCRKAQPDIVEVRATSSEEPGLRRRSSRTTARESGLHGQLSRATARDTPGLPKQTSIATIRDTLVAPQVSRITAKEPGFPGPLSLADGM